MKYDSVVVFTTHFKITGKISRTDTLLKIVSKTKIKIMKILKLLTLAILMFSCNNEEQIIENAKNNELERNSTLSSNNYLVNYQFILSAKLLRISIFCVEKINK